MSRYESHRYDVILVGAGGAGLRAAIEVQQRGLRVAVICKSLLDKAHTVMAEGGVAAAMGNVYPEDNWQVTVSTAVAQGPRHRKESRGAQAREDYANTDPAPGKLNFVQRQTDERGAFAPITINPEPLPVMPAEVAAFFEARH